MTGAAPDIPAMAGPDGPRSAMDATSGAVGAAIADWPDDDADPVRAQEISELVSGALQDAMLAASQPCPATYLDVLESRKRNDIVARLNGLPSVQMSHPVVQAEVLKELAMIRAQCKLASRIVEAIRNYARSKRRAMIAAMS